MAIISPIKRAMLQVILENAFVVTKALIVVTGITNMWRTSESGSLIPAARGCGSRHKPHFPSRHVECEAMA